MRLSEFLIAAMVWVLLLGGLALTLFGALGLAWFGSGSGAPWELVLGLASMAGGVLIAAVKLRRSSTQRP